MKTLQLFDNIELNLHTGRIGISLSGGADSTILLYLLMKYSRGPIMIYTCASDARRRRSGFHALQVIDKCIELTGNNNVKHNIFFVRDQTEENLLSYLNERITLDNLSIMYTGITAAPPVSARELFKNKDFIIDERNPDEFKEPYNGVRKQFYSPFVNIDKKIIRSIYEKESVLYALFPLTRSCESPTQTIGHCGECWWCEERNWAFEGVSRD